MKKKSLGKNAAFNAGYRVLNVIFPFVTSMYVARILHTDGTGKVAYAQNILSYFLVFASLGIPTYGAREVARVSDDRKKLNKLFSELFLINLAATVLCVVVYVLAVLNVSKWSSQSTLFFVVGIQLYLNFLNVDWFYSGCEEFVYIAVRSTVVKILAILAIFLLVKNENQLVLYALINAIGISGNYLLNVINLRGRVNLCFRGLSFAQHLSPIIILLLTILATDLYNQVDITMMGGICSYSEVGCYSYAIKLVRIITALSTAISVTALPRLSRYYAEGDFNGIRELVKRLFNLLLLFVLPAVVGMLIYADIGIRVLYGEAFARTAIMVRVLSPLVVIVSVSYLVGSVTLTAVNREKYLLIATISGAAVNIILNSILIPHLAGPGAAIASVAAELVVFLVHFYLARTYVEVGIFDKEFIKVVLSLAAMTVILLFIRRLISVPILSLLLAILFGTSTYAGVLLATKHTVVLTILNRIKSLKKN